MKWHQKSRYDFPTAILSGISEAVSDWCQEGLIKDPGNRTVKIVFRMREPIPAYAKELLQALSSKVGIPHRSHFADALTVEVVEDSDRADIEVTFCQEADTTKASVDQGLWYDALIVGTEHKL